MTKHTRFAIVRVRVCNESWSPQIVPAPLQGHPKPDLQHHRPAHEISVIRVSFFDTTMK